LPSQSVTSYVEVWLERNALVETFKKFLEGKHVRLVSNRGYGSWTYASENCESQDLTKSEIATVLKVTQPTVSKDLDYIKGQDKEKLQLHI
jgi:DNA-binding transcriptional ArsR family regulator